MNWNQVILAGEIATDLNTRAYDKRTDDETSKHGGLVVSFKLRTLRTRHKAERLLIRCVAFDGAGRAFAQHKQKGERVFVSGRLCQRKFQGREGEHVEHHYVAIESFAFLDPPPGKFIRKHVMVPEDWYHRMRTLEADVPEFYVPPSVQQELLGSVADPWPTPSADEG